MFRRCLLALLALTAAAIAEHMPLWGTYRSNVYTGVRAKVPKSPLFGAMWYNPDTPHAYQHIRHECLDREQIAFGWKEHNGEDYGLHAVDDGEARMQLETRFLRRDDGKGWTLRIDGKRLKKEETPRAALLVYVSLQDAQHAMTVEQTSRKGIHGDVATTLHLGELGSYTMVIHKDESCIHPEITVPLAASRGRHSSFAYKELDATNFVMLGDEDVCVEEDDPSCVKSGGYRRPNPWRVKEFAQQLLQKDYATQIRRRGSKKERELRVQSPIYPNLANNVVDNPRVAIFQLTFELPAKVWVELKPLGESSDWDATERKMSALSAAFHSRFDHLFPTPEQYVGNRYYRSMMTFALSNMLGGVTYFDGSWLLKGSKRKQDSMQLLASVPTRSFFPRGFLWDEGFHLFLVQQWRKETARDIVTSWIQLVDKNGWIGREQILGEEARSRVPPEFQAQDETVANPPTLLLVLADLFCQEKDQYMLGLDMSGSAYDVDESGLDAIYGQVIRHIEWYFNSQTSQEGSSFRWQGRTLTHTLASGLDDYPRIPFLSSKEGHLDLHCWMVLLADTARRLSLTKQDTMVHAKYDTLYHTLLQDLDQFWDSSHDAYYDWAINPDTHTLEYARHSGYVSFFPLMLKLIPASSERLATVLRDLGRADGVWSPYGVRSLAKDDPQFGTKENYWRGPIWMNMNYLIVDALKHYCDEEGPSQALSCNLHTSLRDNLVRNLLAEYKRTGTLWEQYNPDSGHGQRAKAFTGWSSLILLIGSDAD